MEHTRAAPIGRTEHRSGITSVALAQDAGDGRIDFPISSRRLSTEKEIPIILKGDRMIKFIKKHLFATLLTALVGLVTYIGKEELQNIRTEMKEIRCEVAITTVESRSENLDDQFFEAATDDLTMDSPSVKDLETLTARFEKHLALCDRGKKVLGEMQATSTGLRRYMDKNYREAAKQFALLNQNKSITRKWFGSALIREAESLPPGKEADQLRDQASAQFLQMVNLGEKERGTRLKERFLAHQKCYPLLIMRDDNSNKGAVQCYLDVVKSGKSYYLTYYNLAALRSRMGHFDQALSDFKNYLDEGGRKADRRS